MSAITVEDRGPISIIRIARPDRLNAISQAVAVEMQQAFKAFDADPSKRVAILSSEGERAFSSGADVADLPELWRAIPTIGFDTDKPIIAATTGWVIGGAIVILILVAINIVGVKEAASLNVILAVIDFATQVLLVIVGFAIVWGALALFAADGLRAARDARAAGRP